MLASKEFKKDLGKLKFGKVIGFSFNLKNESQSPIEIVKVTVGCGACTKASCNKTNLKPNEEAEIFATFTPGRLGQQTKHINVHYDTDSVLKLEFMADVYE